MNADTLKARFGRIGARLRLSEIATELLRRNAPLTLDVHPDEAGEYFDIRVRSSQPVELDVVDLRRREQHLLLRAKQAVGSPRLLSEHYYLCGHDEQHWFVAAIPESAGPLANVHAAMEALKPPEVIAAQRRQGLKGKSRFSRKNAAFVRQGEWFFLPMPRLRVPNHQVVYHEPLSRGAGSKPHIAECLYRRGGEQVYVCDQHPAGVSVQAYLALVRDNRRAKGWNWRRMFRNPEAFVKGAIRHPDHKTVHLQCWHKVVMNTENQSQAMRHVVFLD